MRSHRSLLVVAPITAVLGIILLLAPPASADPCTRLDCGLGNGGGSTGGGGNEDSGGGGGSNVIPELPGEEGGGGGVNTGPPQAAPPATADLAEWARSTAKLPIPQVHTSPEGKTYVQVRTGLWVDGFNTVQTAPITVGAQTVQATATPQSVRWELGETTLTCNGAGSKDGTSCGYTYHRSSTKAPGGSYKITATIVWTVSWTCSGAECDQAGGGLAEMTQPSAPTPLVVGEIQTNTQQ